jgi:NAD(P)-dependent dehydrogenase (short-subunit alcohol dehydrogenase family)
MQSLKDRHIVVTGGTGALGSAVVKAFVEAGATCHIPAIEAAPPMARLPARNVSVAASIDLADEASVAGFYDKLPPLHAVVNIAGGFAYAPIGDSSAKVVAQQMTMNFLSCALSCRAAVANFRKAGRGGHIVNISARPALNPRSGANMTAYTASKAAVAALTAALAEEVAKDGILVNAVAPSIMDTPANRKAMPKADYGLWPKVEEVAATILFLASPDNRVTRGAIVPVYGKS